MSALDNVLFCEGDPDIFFSNVHDARTEVETMRMESGRLATCLYEVHKCVLAARASGPDEQVDHLGKALYAILSLDRWK